MAMVTLDPKGPFKRDPPLPHQMRDRLTRTEDAVVLCHLGVPRLDRAGWSLTIDGMVGEPRKLGFEDLIYYPRTELVCVHECCGSPLAPFQPTRRVASIQWGGALLADVLTDCKPDAAARYLWSYGADYGEFGGIAIDSYMKDLPIGRIQEDVLIAYEMNGRPLPAEHGHPVRLIVPGFYGTNSVKWLTRMTLADTRAAGPFTTRWYNDPVLDGFDRDSGQTTPVWSIAPESLIVSPASDETIEVSGTHEIWGWAWADGGVRKVYVRCGDAAVWRVAELEPHRGREWQRFSVSWMPPTRGEFLLASLAEANNGLLQPISGRRNAIHEVPVSVL